MIDDDTGKPITPLQGLKWHEKEIKDINALLRDKGIFVDAKKELRLYKKRLLINLGYVIIALNRSK